MNEQQGPLVIDFATFGGPVYIGRPKGEKARKKFDLDKVDNDERTVIVKIPEGTYSINSSFFLGLFGKSIRSSGTREAFLKKYQFSMPDNLSEAIEGFVSRALHEKKPII